MAISAPPLTASTAANRREEFAARLGLFKRQVLAWDADDRPRPRRPQRHGQSEDDRLGKAAHPPIIEPMPDKAPARRRKRRSILDRMTRTPAFYRFTASFSRIGLALVRLLGPKRGPALA